MDAYSLLLQKMSKDELERKIDEKVKEMNGFLTRESAARVLASEMGLLTNEKINLADISEGANKGLVVAKIVRILELRKFENGKQMRKIVVSDESGERELKLWNDDVKLTNGLHPGDVIEIRGIYCKNNELSLGYSGKINVIERASFANLGALADLEGANVNARGYVEEIGKVKEFERDGEKRTMFSFILSDGKNRCRVLMWNRVERGKELFPGAEIKIENAKVKNSELHMNAFSRLLMKRKKQGLVGKISGLRIEDGKLVLEIDGKRHEFIKEDGLRILGANVADDITLETVVELKKKELLGKEVFIEKNDGKIRKAVVI